MDAAKNERKPLSVRRMSTSTAQDNAIGLLRRRSAFRECLASFARIGFDDERGRQFS